MIEPITAQIRHFNYTDDGETVELETSYQLDKDDNIEVVQSWTIDGKPFSIREVDIADLREAINQRRLGV